MPPIYARFAPAAACFVAYALVVGPCTGAVSPAERADMLNAHNALRRSVAKDASAGLGGAVSIPPLTWSAAAASVAQAWANHLLASHRFAHNMDDRNYGENLYSESGYGSTIGSAARAFKGWAGEGQSYRFDTNTCSEQCGHYTQIVWASTGSVGCGVASNNRETIWVCNYAPPGNVVGRRPYDVAGSTLGGRRQ